MSVNFTSEEEENYCLKVALMWPKRSAKKENKRKRRRKRKEKQNEGEGVIEVGDAFT